jgi:hypothetical protein
MNKIILSMKKILLIFCAFTLVTACENEPLDPDFTGGNNNGGGNGSESGDLTLATYQLDTDVNLSLFGLPIQTSTNSTFNITNNLITSGTNAISVSGSPFVPEELAITHNDSDQVVSIISTGSGNITTNETIVTYTNGNISQISYDYYEGDADDYIYNFTYENNVITRTQVGSSITTEFTLDGFDRVIKKESFDDGVSIQIETVTYNGLGNINNSIATGELERNSSFGFDSNTNPLQIVYNSEYLLSFLNDEYSDEIGPNIAQFHSTNNWNSYIINGESFDFDLEYNSSGRINTREISFSASDSQNGVSGSVSVAISEVFNYVN